MIHRPMFEKPASSLDRFLPMSISLPQVARLANWLMSHVLVRERDFDGALGAADRAVALAPYDTFMLSSLMNVTFVEAPDGLIVIDPLVSEETAKYALDLYYAHRPKKPVVAVIYTHSHVDHYGGVRGVVSEGDVKSGKIKVYAPKGFLDAAVAENVMAGNAMNRRASYMYGNLLPPSPDGQVGAGLGPTTSFGTVTLIPPTDIIKENGEKRNIAGLDFEFWMAPGSEAPSEMFFYIPSMKALTLA